MRISEVFLKLKPECVANRLYISTSTNDINDLEKYEEHARDIADVPPENITLILERGPNGILKIAGVENWDEEALSTLPLNQLANLECNFEPKLYEAARILEHYSFFKM